jgi:hypothetical protein
VSTVTGLQKLTEILENALEVGADSVELEYNSGGHLEVCFMKLRASIVELKNKYRGRFPTTLGGTERRVKVEYYDSFGETAFRLKFSKPKRKKGEPGA